MTVIYTLLVAHFVADFIAQTDWMAQNKSKSWLALSLHVGVYSGILFAFVSWAAFFMRGPEPVAPAVLFVAVNGAAHFVQDAITSRINSRLWQAKQVHWFFVGVGADQMLHYFTLFITAGWWLQ